MKNQIVHQQGTSDCGVACLLTVLRHFGGNQSLENLREISGTTTQGTTLLGLVQACPQIGLSGKGLRVETAYLYQIQAPVILPVVIDKRLNHYVVCFPTPSSSEKGVFQIGDPAKGMTTYTTQELEEVWISKAILEAQPNADFLTEKNIQKAKRKWLWELLKPDVELLVIGSIVGVLLALLGMANAIFSQKLIDDILPKAQYIKLYTGLFLLFFLLLARVGLGALRSFILLKQSYHFNQRMIEKFYSSLLYLPKPFFDNRKIGELTSRMNDTRKIQSNISFLAGSVVIDFLNIAISLLFIFSYNYLVGLWSLLSVPLYIFLAYKFNKPILHHQKNVMESYARNESNYIDTIQGISTIKNLGKEPLFTKLTHAIYQQFQDRLLEVGKLGLRFNMWAESIGVLLIVGIFAIVCRQVLFKEMNIGEMTALLAMCGSLIPSVARLAMTNLQIQEAQIAFDRMYEFAALKPENMQMDLPENAPIVFENLVVSNLSFRFAGRKQLFKDVSFNMQKGKILALLGESGSGKSTILQILQRFYKHENGIIELNHADWEQIPTAVWRKAVGIVPQEIKIFNSTLLENICFEDLENNVHKLVELLQKMDLVSFFEQFPQGLLTMVGEQGQKLSGGQKQVVAFLRAIFHKPQILLLDEFTSAMDTSLAKKILKITETLKPDMMILLVTHQPELAQWTDNTVEL
jgi:ATP-binding cassette subfamily B protein